MILQIAFTLVLILACIYAGMYGGRTGRWGGGMLFAAAISTGLVGTIDHNYSAFNPGLFLVDASLLCGLIFLALQSRRRWPIWVAGLHMNTVAGHVAVLLSTGVIHQLYYAMMSVWGIPTLAMMVVGTALDRRYEHRAPSGR